MSRYHRDLGFPDDVVGPSREERLTYTAHARYAARQDRVPLDSLPEWLPDVFDLIEVEIEGGIERKWVVRFTSEYQPERRRDYVLVVTADYLVKTMWVNHTDDQHGTLDRSKYDRP